MLTTMKVHLYACYAVKIHPHPPRKKRGRGGWQCAGPGFVFGQAAHSRERGLDGQTNNCKYTQTETHTDRDFLISELQLLQHNQVNNNM